MTRLAITLGIVVAVTSSWVMGFSENFESYAPGAKISGVNDWEDFGRGDWYEANATASPGDPSFLGTRYADLGNNGNGMEAYPAILAQSFTRVTSGSLLVQFDTRFSAVGPGGLESCNIYLSDGDRTLGLSENLQGVAISVGQDGLRVDDAGWQIVDNFTVQNNVWYHARITIDLDADTWQLVMAAYTGETLGSPTLVSHDNNDSTFAFRDSALNDIGMIEFATTPDIMNDTGAKGFDVDNINVPEPTTLSLLAAAGVLAFRRRTNP